MELTACIKEYQTYLQSTGYAARTVRQRLKHLHCFSRFVAEQALDSLDAFRPEQTSVFIDYWVGHEPSAHTSDGSRCRSRFEPRHHLAVPYSLRSFFRWARGVGYVGREIFPLRAPVRGPYFFPEVSAYLEFCREHRGLAPNSLLQIELFLRRLDHFLPQCQVLDWSRIASHHLDQFVRQQASRNIRRIQRVHKILRGFFRYLFSQGRVDRDWAAALRSPRQYRLARTPRGLPRDQVLRLLAGIDRRQRGGKRDFAILLLAASLGVRASEIARLGLEDVHWVQQTLRFQQLKTGNVLYLPLSPALRQALREYVEQERPATAHRRLFLRLTAPQGPLVARSVSGLLQRRMRQAGITAGGHQLRHAFAQELLGTGIGFSTLQELLGHRRLSSTQIYTKLDLDRLREVADNDGERY